MKPGRSVAKQARQHALAVAAGSVWRFFVWAAQSLLINRSRASWLSGCVPTCVQSCSDLHAGEEKELCDRYESLHAKQAEGLYELACPWRYAGWGISDIGDGHDELGDYGRLSFRAATAIRIRTQSLCRRSLSPHPYLGACHLAPEPGNPQPGHSKAPVLLLLAERLPLSAVARTRTSVMVLQCCTCSSIL